MMAENEKKRGFGINGKTILAILAIISLVPYRYLPKILQDLKNILDFESYTYPNRGLRGLLMNLGSVIYL